MAAITVMYSLIEKRGKVDGHKNFDGFAEGDTSLPDHFVVAKLVKKKKEGKMEKLRNKKSIKKVGYNINPTTPLESLLARSAFNIFKLLYCVATGVDFTYIHCEKGRFPFSFFFHLLQPHEYLQDRLCYSNLAFSFVAVNVVFFRGAKKKKKQTNPLLYFHKLY